MAASVVAPIAFKAAANMALSSKNKINKPPCCSLKEGLLFIGIALSIAGIAAAIFIGNLYLTIPCALVAAGCALGIFCVRKNAAAKLLDADIDKLKQTSKILKSSEKQAKEVMKEVKGENIVLKGSISEFETAEKAFKKAISTLKREKAALRRSQWRYRKDLERQATLNKELSQENDRLGKRSQDLTQEVTRFAEAQKLLKEKTESLSNEEQRLSRVKQEIEALNEALAKKQKNQQALLEQTKLLADRFEQLPQANPKGAT